MRLLVVRGAVLMEHFWVRTMQRGELDECLNSAGPFNERTAAIVAHQTEAKLPESGEFYVKIVSPDSEDF